MFRNIPIIFVPYSFYIQKFKWANIINSFILLNIYFAPFKYNFFTSSSNCLLDSSKFSFTLKGLPNSITKLFFDFLYSPLIANGTIVAFVLYAIDTVPYLKGNKISLFLFLVPSGNIPK